MTSGRSFVRNRRQSFAQPKQSSLSVSIGLASLRSHHTRNCGSLTDVSFEGLSKLETVGDYWLSVNPALKAVSFKGLASLKTVGKARMVGCESLTDVSFEGPSNLETVGDDWLACNAALQCVSLDGLPSLKNIGRGSWLHERGTIVVRGPTGVDELRALCQ